jgi:hypothetical protein
MDSFTQLFNKDHRSELVLLVLMIVYLLLGLETPDAVANIVDSLVGRLSIVLVVIFLFLNANPVLATVAALVAFDIMRRSAENTGSLAIQAYSPSEEKKASNLSAFNQFPYTLEQEVVAKMAPMVHSGTPLESASYKPILDNLHEASSLHNM